MASLTARVPRAPRRSFHHAFAPALALAAALSTSGASAAEEMPALTLAPGPGNGFAAQVASSSPLVLSAYRQLLGNARSLRDPRIRAETLDLIGNERVCVRSRSHLTTTEKQRILAELVAAKLVDPAAEASFPGGLLAGVFPALRDDASDCPHLPQPVFAAPGSYWGGHHSEPGGLMVHEALNDASDLALRANYERVYGSPRADGLPVVGMAAASGPRQGDLPIERDLIVAVPLWHDWAKTYVFQWTDKGSEFPELNFGGTGQLDDYGAAGNSKTGAHHILGLAEAMARHMPADFVLMQASAHSAPTAGNEYKVVNWLRAAAILARIDPVAQGYLVEVNGRYRLAPARAVASSDFKPGMAHTNMLVEYLLHNLSDADFSFTAPALDDVVELLASQAARYGYDPADEARYNWKFRNPVLSTLSAERLYILYSNEGLSALVRELDRLRKEGRI